MTVSCHDVAATSKAPSRSPTTIDTRVLVLIGSSLLVSFAFPVHWLLCLVPLKRPNWQRIDHDADMQSYGGVWPAWCLRVDATLAVQQTGISTAHL